MDDPSMTKVTGQQDKVQVAKDLLEKSNAKKQLKEERRDDDNTSLSPNPGPSTETNTYNGHETKAQARDLAYVEKHLNSCRTMISDLKKLFDGQTALSDLRELAWRQELADVEKGLKFPKTVIAVVGSTGEGKSSLMNALLDHGNVLPTSSMRACTAVVVEVVQNTTSNSFEADIEFLQKNEWFDELNIMLKDIEDGSISQNETHPFYCKVKAVYGKIDSFESLSEITTVTNRLGSTIVIKENEPEEFRCQIEKYITNQDSGTGGQYWPIVKQVRLRMPRSDVCSSGTALVDLPGLRDSNAARDKIANDYLKNCTAVWVVSDIKRAIDDKTAKDVLGENFRRQLLMDGQFGSIAFICTMTDVLMSSEIIRSLHLEGKTKVYEDNIKIMKNEKAALDIEIANVTKMILGLSKTIEEQKNKALAENESLLEPAEGEQSEQLESIQENKKELKTVDALIREKEERLNELFHKKLDALEKKTSLEETISKERNKIVAICALARNDYCSSYIKRNFKDELREMKRLAGMLKTKDSKEEDDINDGDSDHVVRDISSTTDKLQVFCCSSTEYQKMTNQLADDGHPQVFSDLKDTQIPALRNYVHKMTNIQQRQSLERLIHNLGRLVFDMHLYISEGLNTIERGVKAPGIAIENELERLDINLGTVVQKLTADIYDIFDGSLRTKIEEGADLASEEATKTCVKWGAPRIDGGLSCPTYTATTRRNGEYKSHTFGQVDFNADLAAPMFCSIAIVWDMAFSETLLRVFEVLQDDIRTWIQDSTCKLQKQLESFGISVIRTDRLATQVICSANNKLTEMVRHLKDVVTPRQRGISRIVTPHIQTTMLDEYKQCAADSGNGLFGRMKKYMAEGIENKRSSMFDGAKRMIMDELMKLRAELFQHVKGVKDILITDMRRGFEPLWEAPSTSLVARQEFAKVLYEFTVKMRDIYREADIENTDERHKFPALTQGHPGGAAQGSGSVTTVARVQGDSTVARKPDCPTYTDTIHKKEDTSYDTASTEASLIAFGQQTLNYFYQDSLEDNPLEIVKSSPAAVSLLPKIEPDETAACSEPPAKKSKQEETQSTYNQTSHIAGLQTSSEQVLSPSSTRTILSTKMNCSQPAPSGGKGKEPRKEKRKMRSLLLPQTSTPIQTTPTSTVVTEPQDRSIQTTPTVTVKTEPPVTGYSARPKEQVE